jgi:hypothetical protein
MAIYILIMAGIFALFSIHSKTEVGFPSLEAPKSKPSSITSSSRRGVKDRAGRSSNGLDSWERICADFELFKASMDKVGMFEQRASQSRQLVSTNPYVQFWLKQLTSDNPERAQRAEDMLLMVPASNLSLISADLSGPAEHDATPEEEVAKKIKQCLQSAKGYIDEERMWIQVGIEQGSLPPEVTGEELPSFAFGVEKSDEFKGSDTYKATKNSDALILGDAMILVEHFVPRFENSSEDSKERILSLLNLFCYEVYDEPGIEVWRDILQNQEDLERVFAE